MILRNETCYKIASKLRENCKLSSDIHRHILEQFKDISVHKVNVYFYSRLQFSMCNFKKGHKLSNYLNVKRKLEIKQLYSQVHIIIF